MEKFFKRYNGESDEDCIYRICELKEELGYTWPQMADVLNEVLQKNYSDSKYRKDFTAFQKTGRKSLTVVTSQKEEPEKALDIAKERQKLYATKIESSRIVRHVSRQELFYENIGSSLKTLEPPTLQYHDNRFSDNSCEYVLTIADIQAGAKFDVGCNKYSLEECKRRFSVLLDDVSDFVIKNDIRKLHVIELGDTIQGLLRVSDLQLNETSVVNATVTIARLISQFLNELSAFCYVEYYHVPTSNHSQTRNLGTKASELVNEDIEFVIGNYIHDVLKNNDKVNVHLNFGHDHIDIPIFDFNVIALHGHTIKSLESALKDLSVMHRKLMDYVFIGHFHNGKVVPGNAHEGHDTELLVSPSFQGADPYALNKLGLSSKAACKMYQFDAHHGCIGTFKFILN